MLKKEGGIVYEGGIEERGSCPSAKGKGKLTNKAGDVFEGEWKYEGDYMYGTGNAKHANGDEYTGQWRGNEFQSIYEKNTYRKHGQGKLVKKNGEVQEGMWDDDIFQNGKFSSSDNIYIQEGEFKDDKIFNGTGFLKYQNGDTYNGAFANGQKHGKGKYVRSEDNYIYDGDFKDNQFCGTGTLKMKDGTVYEGGFEQDYEGGPSAKGKGRLTNKAGDVFEGEWKTDEQDGCPYEYGTGTVQHANGDVYTGTWRQDLYFYQNHSCKRYGQGRLVKKNGEVQEGTWYDDKLDDGYIQYEGQGVIKYSNGDTYEGALCNGQRHGKGKFVSSSNHYVYEGEFISDRFAGTGTLKKADGTVYEGGIEHDYYGPSAKGKGRLTNKAGDVFEGEWKFEKPYIYGTGTAIYANGDAYTGSWKQNWIFYLSCPCKRQGQGKLVKKNGEVQEGMWDDDKLKGEVVGFKQ